jgi:hypothetical protein
MYELVSPQTSDHPFSGERRTTLNGAFVPEGERGSGSHAMAYMVALTPLRRLLNHSQPGWPTSSEEGMT